MKHRVYVIAEVGNTHEGSIELAKKFIEAVAESGADAVKFQTHLFEAESLPDAPQPAYFKAESRKSYFERTAFTPTEWKGLSAFARKKKLDFLSSPFSIEAVDLLESIQLPAYKIPSGEVTNLPLLKRVAQTKKKVLLSSGMSSWKELDAAVKTLRKYGTRDLTVMQCTSAYPCSPEESGLNVIAEIKKRYRCKVGFSDHTLGTAIPLAAVALGAEVLEKHFTLSKKMYGSDARFSTEPTQFTQLVADVRLINAALVHPVNKDKKAATLKSMKRVFEKSVVASLDIPKGQVIQEKHLSYKKPGDGISAASFMKIIGRKLARSVARNTKLKWEDFV
jgi:N,N'-diacetyllegionaminate synthase